MPKRVYIDGHAGTTGLRIREWLADRDDLTLLVLPDALRKDESSRREMAREADLAVLCLPDDAARQVAEWVTDSDTKLLDASTAHRVAEGWVYGLPELEPGQRDAISEAKNVSNPGCYPTGFVLLVRPLIDAGLVPAQAPLTIHALSGYSGGGRPLIEKWEEPAGGLLAQPFEAPYALDQVHKHVPEMTRYAGLAQAPQFIPAVGPFRCGMRIEVPLHAGLLAAGATAKAVWECLSQRYAGETFVRVLPLADPLDADERTFDPTACNDTNAIELRVIANPAGHVLLMAVLDNLGKGAAGAAIQNLNRMLDLEESAGLPR